VQDLKVRSRKVLFHFDLYQRFFFSFFYVATVAKFQDSISLC
jgi:hypothetical protein